MSRRAGNVGLGKGRRTPSLAVEVAAGNDKFDTTSHPFNEPTSPGNLNATAVDNRVLSFPAAPGRLFIPRGTPLRNLCINPSSAYGRALSVLWAIEDMVHHPSRPSDDFIVKRAVGILRHG